MSKEQDEVNEYFEMTRHCLKLLEAKMIIMGLLDCADVISGQIKSLNGFQRVINKILAGKTNG